MSYCARKKRWIPSHLSLNSWVTFAKFWKTCQKASLSHYLIEMSRSPLRNSSSFLLLWQDNYRGQVAIIYSLVSVRAFMKAKFPSTRTSLSTCVSLPFSWLIARSLVTFGLLHRLTLLAHLSSEIQFQFLGTAINQGSLINYQAREKLRRLEGEN